jgi:hypothetical protein
MHKTSTLRKLVWTVLSAALWIAGCGVACQAQAASIEGQAQGAGANAQPVPQPETKPAPPTPIAEKKEELGDDNTWNPEWDKFIEENLPADLLSPERAREVKSLCPAFKRMSETDRRAFWAYFFQALAGAEAGLEPTANVKHTDPEVAIVDPVTHRVARQEGLLQLQYADSQRYDCNFDWEKDKELAEHDPQKSILQPENNLKCGIKILENQLVTQHKPVLSKSSYWVTLRPSTMSFSVFRKQLANLPAACGASPYRRKSPASTQASEAEKLSQEGTAGTAEGGNALEK